MGQAYRPRRIDVRLNGTLWTADGGRFGATVLDISAHGFRIEIDEPLAVGERVRLAIDAKHVAEAEIKWVLGREAGGTFDGRVPDVA